MATIKPFRALRPDPLYADQLVFPSGEQIFFIGSGETVIPLKPLKEQLEMPARKRPETEDGQRQAYEEIKENIGRLKKLERIRLDDKPGIYIYEIVHRDYRQTGIWALTPIKDYTEGKIKIHEQTLPGIERRICNYRKHTGLEGSPVLLTYPPDGAINRIIAETCASEKKTTVGNKNGLHRIWRVQGAETLKALIAAFARIGQVYLADGHHRLAATERLAGGHGSNALVSSLYIASDQLRIIGYHRVFIPENQLDKAAVLSWLEGLCTIVPVKDNQPVRPASKQLIGMWLEGDWYELVLKDTAMLDVVYLHEHILLPLFGVTDPGTDSRLNYIGGETAMEEIKGILKAVPSALAFTLCPMTVDELMGAGASGQMLPPKSTWIDPKVPYGLLMYQHSYQGMDISMQHYD